MKIIMSQGGLGNNMFQYAFMKELHYRTGEPCCILIYRSNILHGGYLVDTAFEFAYQYQGLNKILRFLFEIIEKLFSGNCFPTIKLLRIFFKIVKYHKFSYNEDIAFGYGKKNRIFYGMWQSEKYFSHVKNEVRSDFTFNEELFSDYTRNMVMKIISFDNSVCIHVRRGDYLQKRYENLAKAISPDYYHKAIAYMGEKIKEPKYFIFSDDFEYCRSVFIGEQFIFVDGNNTEGDAWQDMYLMSLCKNSIIPNSTFSWWGAWLNNNPNKIVIAPKTWYYGVEKDDVVPESWIRI